MVLDSTSINLLWHTLSKNFSRSMSATYTKPCHGHPWCLAMSFPLLGQARDFHPLDCAHAGHTKQPENSLAIFRLGFIFIFLVRETNCRNVYKT